MKARRLFAGLAQCLAGLLELVVVSNEVGFEVGDAMLVGVQYRSA
ncbi:hypothetical protein [Kribbella sp. C-35]